MLFIVVFVTAVFLLFLIKLRWPKENNFYAIHRFQIVPVVREILEWIVVVRENVSVFRQANGKETIENVLSAFFSFFSNLTFGFPAFILKN